MESNPLFNEVTISFGQHHKEIFEARDLFEDELLKFLKTIQDTLKLNKWEMGWDCGNGSNDSYPNYEEFVNDKPFFIDNKSRVYLFNHNSKKQEYYALFGFSFDLENNGDGIVFFTSIAADEGLDKALEDNLKDFKSKVLYDGEYIRYGCNIPLKDVSLEDAKNEVKRLLKVWKDFTTVRKKRKLLKIYL